MQTLQDIFDIIKAHPSATGDVTLRITLNQEDGSFSLVSQKSCLHIRCDTLENAIILGRERAILRAEATVRRLEGARRADEGVQTKEARARMQSFSKSIEKLNAARDLLKSV